MFVYTNLTYSKNQDPEQKRLALLLVTLLIDDHADHMKLEDIFDQVYELFVEEYTDDSTDALLIALLQGECYFIKSKNHFE